jgi:hypothetical protein
MTDLTRPAESTPTAVKTMQALIYQAPNKKALEDRQIPVVVVSADAIVRLTKTTICGTHLHILKGDVASCLPGWSSCSFPYGLWSSRHSPLFDYNHR